MSPTRGDRYMYMDTTMSRKKQPKPIGLRTAAGAARLVRYAPAAAARADRAARRAEHLRAPGLLGLAAEAARCDGSGDEREHNHHAVTQAEHSAHMPGLPRRLDPGARRLLSTVPWPLGSR